MHTTHHQHPVLVFLLCSAVLYTSNERSLKVHVQLLLRGRAAAFIQRESTLFKIRRSAAAFADKLVSE